MPTDIGRPVFAHHRRSAGPGIAAAASIHHQQDFPLVSGPSPAAVIEQRFRFIFLRCVDGR